MRATFKMRSCARADKPIRRTAISSVRSSLYGAAGTSMWISMRSSSGPLILLRYRWMMAGLQRHSRYSDSSLIARNACLPRISGR